MAGFSWRTAEKSEEWSSTDHVLSNHIHIDSNVLKGTLTLSNLGLQHKVHTHISCPKTTLSNRRQLKFPNPQEDVIEHTFYYVPIYDC